MSRKEPPLTWSSYSVEGCCNLAHCNPVTVVVPVKLLSSLVTCYVKLIASLLFMNLVVLCVVVL